MSAPAKQGASRWGSFLQQAVAGIESNLDNILSGDDVPQTKPTPAPAPKPAPPSRTSSPANDRLKERLAKAVAARSHAAKQNGSDSPASATPSRTASPAPAAPSPRQSLDITATDKEKKSEETDEPANSQDEVAKSVEGDATAIKASTGGEKPDVADTAAVEKTEAVSTDKPAEAETNGARQSLGSIASPKASTSTARPSGEAASREQQILADADRELEIHGYIERIDALQAKLKYLANESAESARKAAASAEAGSIEKKLAEKDEQIALLMEEGQRLSKTELKHMTLIKSLRQKTIQTEKEAKVKEAQVEKVEKEKAALNTKLSTAESAQKTAKELEKRTTQLQKELNKLKADNSSKDAQISSLKSQLGEAASQAKAHEVKKVQALLDAERKKVNELEEDISTAKIEKELSEEKSRVQINELKETMERQTERAKAAEVELKGEVQLLESRLEVFRARAEEVSSGATGDAQAKLLRQIETLQSQYAVASENWQGIETTLTSRITALQKERDEALKRESDTRKKAREMTLKNKCKDDELESFQSKIEELSQETEQLRSQTSKLQQKVGQAEKALREAKETFDREKADLQQVFDLERSKYASSSPAPPHSPFAAPSDIASFRRGLTAEYLGLQNLQTSRRPSRSIIEAISGPNGERKMSRTGSYKVLQSAGHVTPKRQDSATLLSPLDAEQGQRRMEPDDYFENVESPAPAHEGRNGADIGSVSTTAAGPSVQLVERMSAAVRRLENEKVALREEAARLVGQRDEARAQLVGMGKEIEGMRGDRERIAELEGEVKQLEERLEAALEMLGEKSEQVGELREDLADLKGAYRGLAEEFAKVKAEQ